MYKVSKFKEFWAVWLDNELVCVCVYRKGAEALMAHLTRRAGFGANRDELEAYVAKGYEATVEGLLHPVDDAYLERDVVDRYYIEIEDQRQATSAGGWWLYRMINTRSPLQEKMTLFWHGLFATAYEKIMKAGQSPLRLICSAAIA